MPSGVPDVKIAILLSLKPVLTIENVDDETFTMAFITPKGAKTLTFKGSDDQTEVDLTKVDDGVPPVSNLCRCGSMLLLQNYLKHTKNLACSLKGGFNTLPLVRQHFLRDAKMAKSCLIFRCLVTSSLTRLPLKTGP